MRKVYLFLSLCLLSVSLTLSAQQSLNLRSMGVVQPQAGDCMAFPSSAQGLGVARAASGDYIQDPKCLTNLPADSAIFVQNFNPAEAGTVLSEATILSSDLVELFVGNRVTKIQTVVPAGDAEVKLWVVDADEQTDTLYCRDVTGTYEGDVVTEFDVDFEVDKPRNLLVGFTQYCRSDMPLHAYIVPCNRTAAWVVQDSNAGDMEWRDYTYMRYLLYGSSNLCYGYYFNLLTEGEAGLKVHDMRFTDVSHTHAFLGDITNFSMGFYNYGVGRISSAKFECTVGENVREAFYESPLGYLAYGSVAVDVPVPSTPQRLPLRARLVEVGGVPLEDVQQAEGSVTIVDRTKSIQRTIVMEEFTGDWCGWCPRGHVATELLREWYGDIFLPIAVHFNDDFYTPANDYVLNNHANGAFPGCTLNRLISGDPYGGSAGGMKEEPGIVDDIAYVWDYPSEGNLKITGLSLSDDFRRLLITTESDFNIDCEYMPYAVAYAVTEDSLMGVQTNYFPISYGQDPSSLPTYLRELASMGSKYLTNFNHVQRSWVQPSVEEGNLFGSIVAKQKYTCTYELTLPDNIQNIHNCQINAMLMDTQADEIVNADYARLSTLTAVDPVSADCMAPQLAMENGRLTIRCPRGSVQFYTPDGRLVEECRVDGACRLQAQPGVYVVRVASPAGTVSRKVVF